MYQKSMIDRYKIFYLFLLIVPFFNIIGLKLGNAIPVGIISLFCFFNILFYSKNSIPSKLTTTLILLFMLLFFLFISEMHSLISLEKSNFYPIRFFGLGILFLVFYILIYNPLVFAEKYLNKLLIFYIYIFSLSICIDYVILHSTLDLSLQPMYQESSSSYFNRPFGITGQPSVNSVLLVFFYTFLLSKNNLKQTKILFFLVTIGVLLQGSGSGFIAYLMLIIVILSRTNIVLKYFCYCLLGGTFFWLTLNLDFFHKISWQYITEIYLFFIEEVNEWVEYLNAEPNALLIVLFGGAPPIGHDIGPLFMISRVGLIYFTLFIILIITVIRKSQNIYEKYAVYILLVGNLHYPVMFYAIMVFILPLLIYKILYLSCFIRKTNEIS